jgi:deferrochelatase/peroxidase EfeB
MRHALVTIAARIAVDKIAPAEALIRALGNPATATAAAALDTLDGEAGIHFASLHAFAGTDPDSAHGHLVLEFSADGDDDAAIGRIAARLGDALRPIFALAADWRGGDLPTYLKAHAVRLGQGWFGQAGLAFAGTPGMSVGRIRREAALADALGKRLGAQRGGLSALDRLNQIRKDVRDENDLAWALETPVSLPVAPKRTILQLIAPLAVSFLRTYLWPLLLPLLIVLGFGACQAIDAVQVIHAADASLTMKLWMCVKAIWSGLLWLAGVACVFAIFVLLLLVALYASLRRKEDSDWLDNRAPRRDILQRIVENENHVAQNHMISVTRHKPGLTRQVTLRFAFWATGQLARLLFRPGFLNQIGTIHFARWVVLPGSKDLMFVSNYGGSWESYLEDFITKAHSGLTAIWSNTVGFPYSKNLFQQGATDGERFKRYARHSMAPTPFWYSAYPTLTTANIRTNAAIRVGLAGAMTDEEAIAWMALFGSAARPSAKLESNQIQSLLFGGLGFLRHGTLILIELKDDMPATRGWLREIRPHIAFDDGRRLKRDAVLTLALGPDTLAKAGLPADAIETFPPAYLDGMRGPGRSRILGDDPQDRWTWKPAGTHDVAILVYGKDERSVSGLVDTVKGVTQSYGHDVFDTIPLRKVPKDRAKRKEPFGFIDGTSQPLIRGTYRGLRFADPIHLVEAGEFILGYPDNRGNVPPGPMLRALDDPDNMLPIRCDNTGGFASNVVDAPREIGRNGSFLVIRQLEQDYDAFWSYCESQAADLRERLGEPYNVTAEFIGAKMVGRWKDGSSLLRNPYQSFSESKDLEQNPTRRAATNPAGRTPIAAAPSANPRSPADSATAPATTSDADTTKKKTRPGNPEDNDFLFGTEDPEGLRCPFGAHIRRANPRDSLSPGSQEQVEISNRHRILRVGRQYEPRDGQKKGLMFMCLNGDIERQFEFVQQTWLHSETFHGLSGERDPLTAEKNGCPIGYTIPTRDGPVRLKPMSRFITARGGGYFFVPGKRLLEFLSA